VLLLLAVQVLTLPSFPVSVLGTFVNKRARYSYLRKVDAAESLTYRWALQSVLPNCHSVTAVQSSMKSSKDTQPLHARL
jgi:hypothetical protein